MDNKTLIIIPVFNESNSLRSVLLKVKKIHNQILVIDDGSTDDTALIASQEGVTVLSHAVNLGKGSALKTGLNYAQLHAFQKIIFMDADGQHNPDEIPKFISGLKKNEFVLGVRHIAVKNSFIRSIGNRLDSLLIKILFGVSVNDPLCGFRAFHMKIYKDINWESNRYGVETEMIIRAIKKNIKIYEVRVSTIYFDKYKGVSIIDAAKILLDVIKWRLLL